MRDSLKRSAELWTKWGQQCKLEKLASSKIYIGNKIEVHKCLVLKHPNFREVYFKNWKFSIKSDLYFKKIPTKAFECYNKKNIALHSLAKIYFIFKYKYYQNVHQYTNTCYSPNVLKRKTIPGKLFIELTSWCNNFSAQAKTNGLLI